MSRTKLCDRRLPAYTNAQECFNMVSHIVGGGLGVITLVLCVIRAALNGDAWGVVGSAVYGTSLVALYTMSSVYHGIRHETAKKVMQVMDHCTIYFLIAGTYTPILLCAIRRVSPVWSWVLFGVVWGLAALAITLTAIDLKKYATFSMICYIGMGWCIVMAGKVALQAIPTAGLWYLLAGGIAYTVGAVIYGVGKKFPPMHGVFHLFVVLGSALHAVCIFFYIL
ncbi:MAG: hemolysin III family protein [Clostridia bacterium]|nr:hemolysin III family protein [Clostridia bacterium]